jgi:glucokinase
MAKLVAGVDLGGTKIQTVVVSSGNVIGSSRIPTPQTGADAVVSAIATTVEDSIRSAGATEADLAAVGIGSPGEIDSATGIVMRSPNIPGCLEPVELGPFVSKLLSGVPVILDNDVRVAILGEQKRGAGRKYRDFLGVFVGTGVGGGIVLGGKLRHGEGAAGEIGHTLVREGGRRCSDGMRGHLEAYAGRKRIEAEALRRVKKGQKTILFDLMKKKGKLRVTSGVINAALKRKDGMTRRLIDDAVWAMGIALSNAQNLLDVRAIIVGGGLGDKLGKPFVDRIAAEVQPRLFSPDKAPAMLTTELGDLSGAVGAAVLAGG